MVNVAIFASGNGDNAEQLVKTFNSGTRIQTVVCLTDSASAPVIEKMAQLNVVTEFLPEQVWRETPEIILDMLRSRKVDIIVLDGFSGILRPEIIEAYEGHILREGDRPMPELVLQYLKENGQASGEASASGEVVTADAVEPSEKSVDDEWAETLGVKNNVQPDMPNEQPEGEVENFGNTQSVSDANAKPWMQNREYGMSNGANSGNTYGNGYNGMNRYNQGGNNQRVSGMPNGGNLQGATEPMPSTWLVWSVLATVLCCTIPGIVAIIQSARVSSKYYAGDIEGAKRASRNAEIWIIIAFVLGVISNTLYLPLTIAGFF